MNLKRLAAYALFFMAIAAMGIGTTSVAAASTPLKTGISLSINSGVDRGLGYELITGNVWFANSTGTFGLPGIGINQPGRGVGLVYGPWGKSADNVIHDCDSSPPSNSNGKFQCKWYGGFQAGPPGAYNLTAAFHDSTGRYASAKATQEFQVNSPLGINLSLVVEGLPSGIQTTLQIGSDTPVQVGSGRYSFTKPNSTQMISVTQQVSSASGDAQYRCGAFSYNVSKSVTSVTFAYATWFQFKVTGGGLPANLSSQETLDLKVNGTDLKASFNPAEGMNSFYPQNTIVDFEITPSYIHSPDLDYKFAGWANPATGQEINLPTIQGGLFDVSLTQPVSVMAEYTEWVEVRIESNLPDNMSTLIQVSDPNGTMRTVSVPGSVVYSPYPEGLLPAGSTIKIAVKPTQLLFFSKDGGTRYEFQNVTPTSPIILSRHTTITLNYVTQYRVQVASPLPDAILQPTNGEGWFGSGKKITLQVEASANDRIGVPYLFDGWSGLPESSSEAANQTTVNLTVNGPLQVSVQWKPNWTYILIFTCVASAISIPTALVGRRKLKVRKQNSPVKPGSDTDDQPDPILQDRPESDTENDVKLYGYIIEKGGSLHIPDAMKELNMTREQVNESVRRLKETRMLHEKKA